MMLHLKIALLLLSLLPFNRVHSPQLCSVGGRKLQLYKVEVLVKVRSSAEQLEISKIPRSKKTTAQNQTIISTNFWVTTNLLTGRPPRSQAKKAAMES